MDRNAFEYAIRGYMLLENLIFFLLEFFVLKLLLHFILKRERGIHRERERERARESDSQTYASFCILLLNLIAIADEYFTISEFLRHRIGKYYL